MIGIYRGIVVDALTVARNHGVDLWVVEAGSRGPFAEASRIPGRQPRGDCPLGRRDGSRLGDLSDR